MKSLYRAFSFLITVSLTIGFLLASCSRSNTPITNIEIDDLYDFYNSKSILHNAWSDFECWIMINQDGADELLSYNTSSIIDDNIRSSVLYYLVALGKCAYADTILFSMYDKYEMASPFYNNLDSITTVSFLDKYPGAFDSKAFSKAVSNCYSSGSITDYKKIKSKYGSEDMDYYNQLLKRYYTTQSFDDKCVLALSIPHIADSTYINEEGDYVELNVELLEECMESESYSVLLYDVWKTWSTMYQFYYGGASRYSHIHNTLYNSMRRRCLETILERIEEDSTDVLAITQFLLLSNTSNIYRIGAYKFGNQNDVQFFQMFSEKVEKLKLSDR